MVGEYKSKNIWLDGIMGVVVGDALGVPVEFCSREELKAGPVEDMEGHGTYDMPVGCWSDDSSMVLATLDSLKGGYRPEDIMDRFVKWLEEGEYTPTGLTFDVGNTCCKAIERYMVEHNTVTCGGTGERDNGNGSLMRILPICLYMYEKQKREGLSNDDVIVMVHEASALTHAHMRSKVACGLYFFMVRSILEKEGGMQEVLQAGLDEGFAYYRQFTECTEELKHYERICNLEQFKHIMEEEIKSSGYVVATLEAALWSCLRTESYKAALLTAVNLGDDTDTVAAVAGGLVGLYYGHEGIPKEWLESIRRREWIENLVFDVANGKVECFERLGEMMNEIHTCLSTEIKSTLNQVNAATESILEQCELMANHLKVSAKTDEKD